MNAAGYALLSAVLFGLSTPVAKLLVAAIDPWLLAALLYAGSGMGLAAVHLLSPRRRRGEAALGRRDWGWLSAAILAGGVAGPVLLMAGLSRTDASTASLLLTSEGVFTALIAWFAFNENFDWRIAAGMACIVVGAAVLAWPGELRLGTAVGPLAIVGACCAWAIDNNLTRKVALADPVRIAMWKGLMASPVTLLLAYVSGASLPAAGTVAIAVAVGFLSYGVSLVLFVLALRTLGTARTGAYFSTAPFLGAVAAVALLGEPVSAQLGVAGALMAIGVWLHLTEHHEHEHVHEPMAHTHRHTHDVHHQHEHASGDPAGEPHTHPHQHSPLRHAHPHTPDAHHHHTH